MTINHRATLHTRAQGLQHLEDSQSPTPNGRCEVGLQIRVDAQGEPLHELCLQRYACLVGFLDKPCEPTLLCELRRVFELADVLMSR